MMKEQLRKIYIKKRKDLTSIEVDELEKSIYNQIMEIDLSSVKNIHIFLSIERYKEINTYPIIDFLRKKGKNIIISKSNFSDGTLTHYLLEKNTLLEVNKWGIPEPINAIEFDVKQLDLVFVPMLISDEQKYRVGYGKGFYDRFISECKSDIKTIGLNFFKPIKKIEDIHEFDVSLDAVIYGK